MPYSGFTFDAAKAELGLGQVIGAAVDGAGEFNRRADLVRPVYGRVTTGEDWQFLRLGGTTVVFDAEGFDINRVELILAALSVAAAP